MYQRERFLLSGDYNKLQNVTQLITVIICSCEGWTWNTAMEKLWYSLLLAEKL